MFALTGSVQGLTFHLLHAQLLFSLISEFVLSAKPKVATFVARRPAGPTFFSSVGRNRLALDPGDCMDTGGGEGVNITSPRSF